MRHTGALHNSEFSKDDCESSHRKLEIVNMGVYVFTIDNLNSKFKNGEVLRGCAFLYLDFGSSSGCS